MNRPSINSTLIRRLAAPCLLFLLGNFNPLAERLNIVFILIDDLGWTDLGCYGSRYYETPNVDRLARQGMRFTNAYAASCVCSPTRASILTGKYPGRLHITHAIPIQGTARIKEPLPMIEATYRKNLPLEEITIAESLKEAGYATAFMGKWHVCWENKFYPEHQGFDLNIGGNNMGNPGNYFHPYDGQWRMTPRHPITRWNTLPDGKPGEYLTDRLTNEAVAFIEKNKSRPFFLYLSHYAVHTPLQAKKELIAKYKGTPQTEHPGNATYAAMIESVDQSLGKVLKKLDTLELTERTVIIFTSDNGGHGRITSHLPLRGNKGSFYEGGIRVPLIVKWPSKVKPGTECRVPVISPDFYPTLLAVTGLKERPQQHVDGGSLVSMLKQEAKIKPRSIYWHYPNYIGANHPGGARPCSVIRKGNWKLIESLEENRAELYNLKDDLGEKENLAMRMPKKTRQLRRMLEQWRNEAQVQMPERNPDFDGK